MGSQSQSTRTDLRQFELVQPLSITIPSVCLSSARKRKGHSRFNTDISSNHDFNNIMYCICLDYHNNHFVHRKPWTDSPRFCDNKTSNRGGGIDQCPISQTRAVHRHKRSYVFCCYSRCPASHWILVHNTFEGVVTNYGAVISKYG